MERIRFFHILFYWILFVQQSSVFGFDDDDETDKFVVRIDSGQVQGMHYHLPHLSTSGISFLGIPYAEPPTGSRRFTYPERIQRWNKIFKAHKLPESCYQVPDLFFGDEFPGSNMWNPNTRLSEDCLKVNVWVPETNKDAPDAGSLPVMVWIFGGGFYSGTTTLEVYDGRILASLHNVIVVSIGYRVGSLGFLCLDHPSAPCNVGMFDQLMGLDWVQRNIANFGGNPKNVTLFGESAGSASVSLHLLSPLSRDKFHRAILQSGTANMPWATTTVEEAKRRSIEFAVDYLKCEDKDDMDKLVRCLRSIPPQRLVDEQWVSRYILQFPFLPVVDGRFLIEPPDYAIRHGHFKRCPILIGSNLNEGSWFIIYELFDLLTLDKKSMNRTEFIDSMEKIFFTYPQYPQKLNNSFALEAIQFRYTDWLNPEDADANLRGLDGAVADFFFVCPLNRFATSYASAGNPVYMYFFTHRYHSHPWPEWMGVLHGDEVIFTFGQPLKPGTNFTADEKELSRSIMRYWTNFVKTGNPNDGRSMETSPVWPVYTAEEKFYLELNSIFLHSTRQNEAAVGRGPRTDFCAFWFDYLPQLIATTGNIVEKEKEWKLQFEEWSTRYIVDWKMNYDAFLKHHQNKNKCNPR